MAAGRATSSQANTRTRTRLTRRPWRRWRCARGLRWSKSYCARFPQRSAYCFGVSLRARGGNFYVGVTINPSDSAAAGLSSILRSVQPGVLYYLREKNARFVFQSMLVDALCLCLRVRCAHDCVAYARGSVVRLVASCLRAQLDGLSYCGAVFASKFASRGQAAPSLRLAVELLLYAPG